MVDFGQIIDQLLNVIYGNMNVVDDSSALRPGAAFVMPPDRVSGVDRTHCVILSLGKMSPIEDGDKVADCLGMGT